MKANGKKELLDILIPLALSEDIGRGDITSKHFIPKNTAVTARIIAKEEAVICGLDIAKEVFKRIDRHVKFHCLVMDGDSVKPGQAVARLKGMATSILAGERTALNILQRLSGISTISREFVKRTKGTKAVILDTRKTTPCFRAIEKYAVRKGGATNHRMGLYDAVLVKDNHIAANPNIVRDILKSDKGLKKEIEAGSIKQVRSALEAKASRILLDNMSISELKKAIGIIRKSDRERGRKTEIEASGGITLNNVRAVAKTGVDYISVGALTHSPKAVDLSLKIEPHRKR
jgi:nicotinate-nucleotide pyrophosphorylase (carboxylating)